MITVGTHDKMKAFLDQVTFIDQGSLAGMIGLKPPAFNAWLNCHGFYGSHPDIDSLCEKFLETDGLELLYIQLAFAEGAGNRTELHRRRSAILNKTREHVDLQPHVPSQQVA